MHQLAAANYVAAQRVSRCSLYRTAGITRRPRHLLARRAKTLGAQISLAHMAARRRAAASSPSWPRRTPGDETCSSGNEGHRRRRDDCSYRRSRANGCAIRSCQYKDARRRRAARMTSWPGFARCLALPSGAQLESNA